MSGGSREYRPLRRPVVVLIAAISLAAACTSGLDSNSGDADAPPPTLADGSYAYEDATVTGEVVGADGAPRDGVEVSVMAEATNASRTNAVLTMMFTGGLACFADLCDGLEDREVASVVTADDGAYSAVLPEAYLAGYETDTDWLVVASVPAADGQIVGPTSGFEFETNTPIQEAPSLALWEATPSVTTGPLLTVTLATPPDVDDATDERTEVEFVSRTGTPVWTMQGETVDARLLEDFPLRLLGRHEASVRVGHDHGRTIYHQRLISGVVAYTGDHVPASRGAACTVEPAVPGCPVTDGAVEDVADNPLTSATVELAEPVSVGVVVVRGPSDCSVDVAAGDGWEALEVTPLVGAPGVTASPEDAVTSGRIRVGGDRCRGITEVSTWDAASSGVGHNGDRDTGLLESTDGDRRLGTWGWLAAVVAAAMAGIVGSSAVTRLRSERWRRSNR